MTPPAFHQRLARKLSKSFSSLFFIDQWIIMTARRASYQALDWRLFQPLIPPKDRYWADPFVVQRGECYYVFVEEKLYSAGRGRISCLTLDLEGRLLSQQVVLERPYHLSYPFIFDRGGDLFMIPETAANRTVELYRCAHFPDRWESVRNLLTDLYAVDATLLEHNSQFWLFANVKARGGNSLDSLHLFYASDPLAGAWRPHPRNPVVTDISTARPAGRIFVQDGSLIRPAQDCARRYGYALRFSRITTLNETDYAESLEQSFTPRGSQYLATHTFSQAGDLTVVDAVLRRRKS